MNLAGVEMAECAQVMDGPRDIRTLAFETIATLYPFPISGWVCIQLQNILDGLKLRYYIS